MEAITACAQDMTESLKERDLTERRAFSEIVAMPGKAMILYKISVIQSTPKNQIYMGGGA